MVASSSEPEERRNMKSKQASENVNKKSDKAATLSKGSVEYTVYLMDGSNYAFQVNKTALGKELFDKVVEFLSILEKDYFGLSFHDTKGFKTWIQLDKQLSKQLKKGANSLHFEVKFYPPEPEQLQEDITRYYLCSQVQNDITSGKLACSPVTLATLGAYFAQAQLGDFDLQDKEDYLSALQFAPQNTSDLLYRVKELHKTHKGQKPSEAEYHYLENAKKLALYGVHLHKAKDSDNVDVDLAVCSAGILVYRDMLRINRLAWPKILKISYRSNNFYAKIRPGEFEQRETVLAFKFPSSAAAKNFWKTCVENHAFFRLMSPEPMSGKGLASLGSSRFRFSGRTQYQTRLASGLIQRPEPAFVRSVSSRFPVKQHEPAVTVRNVVSDYKPAESGSPMKFADASTKEGRSPVVSTPLLTVSHVSVLPFDKSPDELLPYEAAYQYAVTPPPPPPTTSSTGAISVHDTSADEPTVRMQQIVLEARPAKSETSQSTSDTSRSSGHVSPASAMPKIVEPVLLSHQPVMEETTFTQQQSSSPPPPPPLPMSDKERKKLEKQRAKEEKERLKRAKQEEKKRAKELKLLKGKSAEAPPPAPVLAENYVDTVGGYCPLTVLPVRPGSSLSTEFATAAAGKQQPVAVSSASWSPTMTGRSGDGHHYFRETTLSLDRSGLDESIPIDDYDEEGAAGRAIFRPTHTPPATSPNRISPRTVTTIVTNEESVHNVPAQIMSVKTSDGAVTTTTTASQIRTVKQTIQTNSFETFNVPVAAAIGGGAPETHFVREVETENRILSSGNVQNSRFANEEQGEFVLPPGATLVSREYKSDDGRTVETITYKIEREDGVVETHVEHRVTVRSHNTDIDHDKELSAAILEATMMNPNMTVEKVELRRSGGQTDV